MSAPVLKIETVYGSGDNSISRLLSGMLRLLLVNVDSW